MKKDKKDKKDKKRSLPAEATRMKRDTKTHHRTGYHKPIRNPTTNAAPDSHKKFCKRCLGYNHGICPVTGKSRPSNQCSI